MKYKGAIATTTVVALATLAIGGVGGFFGATATLYSDIRDNKDEIGRVKKDFENIDGKLTELLNHFDLKYEPKN